MGIARAARRPPEPGAAALGTLRRPFRPAAGCRASTPWSLGGPPTGTVLARIVIRIVRNVEPRSVAAARAGPKRAQFWVRKAEAENRTVWDGQVLTGTCWRYTWNQGWGFILPDDPQELPGKVGAKLREAVKEARAAGRETGGANAVYFRKPGVEANFRNKIKEGSLVTFQLYIDDKGVSAYDVCDAGGGEEEEAES